MKTKFLIAIPLLAAILFSACGKDENPDPAADQYVRLSINGIEYLNVSGTVGSLDDNAILANVTVDDNGGLAANTVQIGAVVFDEEGGEVAQTLSISLQGITSPGTYDLVENDGIFVYTTADAGKYEEGYTVAEEEDGVCTVVIEEIGGNARPGLGKPIKGTFSATVIINGDGNTHTLTGEFNGGV